MKNCHAKIIHEGMSFRIAPTIARLFLPNRNCFKFLKNGNFELNTG